MLLQAYLRLDDPTKSELAEIFANRAFYQLIRQVYVEIQQELINVQDNDEISDSAFRLRYRTVQQKLKDIDDLNTFIEQGREDYQALVSAYEAQQPQEIQIREA